MVLYGSSEGRSTEKQAAFRDLYSLERKENTLKRDRHFRAER